MYKSHLAGAITANQNNLLNDGLQPCPYSLLIFSGVKWFVVTWTTAMLNALLCYLSLLERNMHKVIGRGRNARGRYRAKLITRAFLCYPTLRSLAECGHVYFGCESICLCQTSFICMPQCWVCNEAIACHFRFSQSEAPKPSLPLGRIIAGYWSPLNSAKPASCYLN